jgi:hypothetical protein
MSPSSPPPVTTPPQQANAFPHQAAKASWASGVIVFALIALGGRSGGIVVEFIALALMLVGFSLGVIGLFGIRKYGTKHVLAPALVGIIINGVLLFIFITNFMAARAKAQRHVGSVILPVVSASSEAPDRRNELGLYV